MSGDQWEGKVSKESLVDVINGGFPSTSDQPVDFIDWRIGQIQEALYALARELDKRLDGIDKRADALYALARELDRRLDGIDSCMRQQDDLGVDLESRVEALAADINEQDEGMVLLQKRIDALENLFNHGDTFDPLRINIPKPTPPPDTERAKLVERVRMHINAGVEMGMRGMPYPKMLELRDCFNELIAGGG